MGGEGTYLRDIVMQSQCINLIWILSQTNKKKVNQLGKVNTAWEVHIKELPFITLDVIMVM